MSGVGPHRIDTDGDDAIVFEEFWAFFLNPDQFAQVLSSYESAGGW